MPKLTDIARLAHPSDNAAIACADLEAGIVVSHGDTEFTLSHAVLTGHRFAITDITVDQSLRSWDLPFGYAITAIAPGDYLCNEQVLIELARRSLPIVLPQEHNFRDFYEVHTINEFTPGTQVASDISDLSFQGFDRGARGVGTRNCIAILPVSAHASALANKIAKHFNNPSNDLSNNYTNIDAVVSLAHTEAAAGEVTHNHDKVIQTLAGFAIHPNVAAVYIIDAPGQIISWNDVQQCIDDNSMPWSTMLHHVAHMDHAASELFSEAVTCIESWLPQVNAQHRSQQPASRLRIALQCGGSDAFSGVSGNPLAGQIAKKAIRCGGAANLAETSELAGSESYILDNCRDRATADAFLEYNARYRTVAENHGHSLEGNPSGGNFYRGLYNIALKSLGAAMKKPADIRLDYVSAYGERREEPGYFFMDSPGNDLESVAGQVAWGANIILFVTGNGSVTNFPFVPALKIITTTERYNLLPKEMDINAGVYLEGTDMETLTNDSFDLVCDIASGKQCLGEIAGQSQVSIWRSWRLSDGSNLNQLQQRVAADGRSLALKNLNPVAEITIPAQRHAHGVSCCTHALLLPTSLCSAHVADTICDELNYLADGKNPNESNPIQSFVSLVHTEGCGSSSGENVDILLRNYASYIRHPDIIRCCLLEHGCEKVHNQYVVDYLEDNNISANELGRASIQLDGGIDNVSEKVHTWFRDAAKNDSAPVTEDCSLAEFIIAFDAHGEEAEAAVSQDAFIAVVLRYLSLGSTVIIPSSSPLLNNAQLLQHIEYDTNKGIQATIEYGERPQEAGLHIMRCTGRIIAENMTGLAACGAQCICMHIESMPVSGHPFVPVLQLSSYEKVTRDFSGDLDSDPDSDTDNSADWFTLSIACLDHSYQTTVMRAGLNQFQMSRGETGISM